MWRKVASIALIAFHANPVNQGAAMQMDSYEVQTPSTGGSYRFRIVTDSTSRTLNLRKVVPWLCIGVLVTMVVVLAPRLHADGEPPSGVLSQPEPTTAVTETDSAAGLLAPNPTD